LWIEETLIHKRSTLMKTFLKFGQRAFGTCAALLAATMCITTPQASASILISAEMQSVSSSTNMSGDDANAVTLDPVFDGGGLPWNHLNLAQFSTMTVNPSFASLIDRNTGLPTAVGFSLTGSVAGFGNAWTGGNEITRDIWIFGVSGGSSSFDWQISGLTAGDTFKLVLYCSHNSPSLTGINQKVDTNGNGVLDESAVLVQQNTTDIPVLFTGIVGPGGLIKGHGDVAGQTIEGDWSGFQLFVEDAPAVPEPGTLALAALGLAGLGVVAWGRRRKIVDC
jgi:hypothetical protein